MKRIIITYILLYSLLNMVANNFVPYRNVETTGDGVIVTYRFRGGIHQQDPLYPNAKYWKVPGFGLNEESGKPSTLSRWDSFAIPNGANVSVEVLECEYTDTAFVLAPARHALFNNDTIGYTLDNVPPITAYTGFYPTDIIEMSGITNYRGQDIQRIEVHPIQYSHTNGIVRNYSLIKYRVNFDRTNSRNVNSSNVKISPTDPIVNNLVLNPTDIVKSQPAARSNTEDSAIEDNRDYLIVSVPKYEEAVNEFAEWKRILGYRVHVIMEDSYGKSYLKSIIQNLYNQDDVNLCYLLIVGNKNGVVASYKGTKITANRTYDYWSDLYYGYTNDGDIDSFMISRGRILVSNNSEAKVVLNKIIQYEQNPTTDSAFYNTGLHCSYFQDENFDGYEDRRFVQTSEEILNYMETYIEKNIKRVYTTESFVTPRYWNNDDYSYGETLPDYLKKPTFAWAGNSVDIESHINSGCFYILRRGHGDVLGWDKPSFKNMNVASLNNNSKLPVVFSICCKTGNFYSSKRCLAEILLKKENGGCVGIIAATENTFSGYNDVLSEVMFDSMWPDTVLRITMPFYEGLVDNRSIVRPIYEIGNVLDMGMYYMDEIKTGISPTRLYTRELFHCFGDPSMKIRTEVPQKFSPIIKRTNGVISVNANCDSTRISFYTPATKQVDSYLGRAIDYSTTADSVIVCIDKHNYIPFIVNCNKNVYVQNENINDERTYVGENILIGKNVTTLKGQGEVIIQNANVKLQGKEVILQSGTTITNSNVEINTNN